MRCLVPRAEGSRPGEGPCCAWWALVLAAVTHLGHPSGGGMREHAGPQQDDRGMYPRTHSDTGYAL